MNKAMNKPTEHDEQCALFSWAARMEYHHPELRLLFAVPNAGKRSIGSAMYYKAEGLKSGVPDIFLPFPNGVHHGLIIEMKVKGGKVSENQKAWLDALTMEYYAVHVCWSFEEAKSVICKYLSIDEAKNDY